MIQIEISAGAKALFPELGVAVLGVEGVGALDLAAALAEARRTAETILAEVDSYDAVNAFPEVADWKEAFRQMSLRPAEYRSSLEALLRMWANGRKPGDEGLIDLYNLASLGALAPVGAIDPKRLLAGFPIALRVADPDRDSFIPVAGQVTMKPAAQAVSYCSGDKVICYALNHRDSADFGICETTSDVLFFAEWAFARQAAAAKNALLSIKNLLEAAGAGSFSYREVEA